MPPPPRHWQKAWDLVLEAYEWCERKFHEFIEWCNRVIESAPIYLEAAKVIARVSVQFCYERTTQALAKIKDIILRVVGDPLTLFSISSEFGYLQSNLGLARNDLDLSVLSVDDRWDGLSKKAYVNAANAQGVALQSFANKCDEVGSTLNEYGIVLTAFYVALIGNIVALATQFGAEAAAAMTVFLVGEAAAAALASALIASAMLITTVAGFEQEIQRSTRRLTAVLNDVVGFKDRNWPVPGDMHLP